MWLKKKQPGVISSKSTEINVVWLRVKKNVMWFQVKSTEKQRDVFSKRNNEKQQRDVISSRNKKTTQSDFE